MNIAVNCRLLQKGQLEGIGWFMYENLKRLTMNHPEHQFYFIFDRPYNPDFIFADNIRPIVVGPPTRHPVLWYLWFEWRLPRILKRCGADMFFSPDGYLSLRSRIPAMTTIHDINFAHRPKDLPFFTRHYYNYFFPRFARKARIITTVSEYSKKDIQQTYQIDQDKIKVVYNGANSAYTPLPDAKKKEVKARYTDGHDYFLFIGSIHPRKNLDNLIKAYDRFIERTGSETRLVIVGTRMWKATSDKRYETSKESVNLGSICTTKIANEQNKLDSSPLASRLSPLFLGRLDPEPLRDVLGAALALTFVPWFEGFGIPVLEAMYSGVPVLTSTETSLPEVGGEAVLYAHPGDIDQIADQMQVLAEEPMIREELIQKGFGQKDRFSWDLTAERVWNSLDNLIETIEIVDE